MNYILVMKKQGVTTYASGDDPKSIKMVSSIDAAKLFASPGDAMEFRARMAPSWHSKLIVYEYDGTMLHSLDV